MEARPTGAQTTPSTPETAATGNADSGAGSVETFPDDLRGPLRDREPDALQTFYDCYFDRMYGYVRRLVGEEHLAEDLTQEIFMHIIEHLDSYDPARALRPWVFTIATNKVRDFWRSRRHRATKQEVSLELDETGGWAKDGAVGPDEGLEIEERSAELEAAISALPDSMRLTLVLRYYKGLSFEEIGKIIDRNEAAVRKRYSRALEELRQTLPGLAPDGPVIEGGES